MRVHTARDSAGEESATIELLAYENGIQPEQIAVSVENQESNGR